uniref:Mid2 domain-containing protein n=1 Tax=Coccidioides posadasii RMSCC 3488 TaxID=454284 RepID=A0A0J6FE10_COCPO|nr:hypothetical protein CPAG_04869 [Coccidioides posadasii RMSCC 3488]
MNVRNDYKVYGEILAAFEPSAQRAQSRKRFEIAETFFLWPVFADPPVFKQMLRRNASRKSVQGGVLTLSWVVKAQAAMNAAQRDGRATGTSAPGCVPQAIESARYRPQDKDMKRPFSAARGETLLTYFDCPDNFEYPFCLSWLNTPTAVATHTTSSTTRVQSEYLVIATPIQVRFQATDSSVVPIPTDSLNLPPPKKPLSKGAKAGIGIGVPVGTIGLAAAVVLFLRRRRRGSSDHVPLQSSMPDPPPAYSETK